MTNRGMASPPPHANWVQFTTERQPMSRHSVSRHSVSGFIGTTPKGNLLPSCSTILCAGQIPKPVPVVCIFSSPPLTLGDYLLLIYSLFAPSAKDLGMKSPVPPSCKTRTSVARQTRNRERSRKSERGMRNGKNSPPAETQGRRGKHK